MEFNAMKNSNKKQSASNLLILLPPLTKSSILPHCRFWRRKYVTSAERLQLYCWHCWRQHSLRKDLYFSLLDSDKRKKKREKYTYTRVLKMDFTAYQYTVPQNLSRNPLYQSLCCTNINQITLGNTQRINKQSTYCSKIRTHTLG